MVKYFWTEEEAELFAAWRRDQGFFAEVCDGSVARLWGPLAVGGCRVVTSETKGEERTEPACAGPVELFLIWVARFWAFVAMVGGVPTILYAVLRATRDLPLHTVVLGLLLVAGWLIAMVLLSVVLSPLTRIWRDAMEGHEPGSGTFLVGLMAALGFLLAFFQVLAVGF